MSGPNFTPSAEGIANAIMNCPAFAPSLRKAMIKTSTLISQNKSNPHASIHAEALKIVNERSKK